MRKVLIVCVPKIAMNAPSTRKSPSSLILSRLAALSATLRASGWSAPRIHGTAIGASAIGTIRFAARRHVLGMKIA